MQTKALIVRNIYEPIAEEKFYPTSSKTEDTANKAKAEESVSLIRKPLNSDLSMNVVLLGSTTLGPY